MPEISLPFVSIIMPVKNEERYIERSLGAVLAQDYPSNKLEVLVADGNSSDHTRDLISKLALTSKFPVSILDNPTGIVPKALNIGLRNARGDIVIRVDGHCEIQEDYVSICVNQLLNQEIDCVGGAIETVGETSVAKVIALAMKTRFGVGNVAFRVNQASTQQTDSVPFPAYWMSIFQRTGLYDEDMLCNEDDEFNYRLLINHGRILMTNKLRTRYYSRGSLSSLWNQYFRYGLWKVRVMQKHPSQMRFRQFVPSFFVMAIVLSLILPLLLPGLWSVPIALLGLYLLAMLLTSILAIKEFQLRNFVALPVVFFTIHLSYGLGFLAGLIKFWNRWSDKVGKVPQM